MITFDLHRLHCRSLPLIAALAFCGSVHAKLLPSFDPDSCAWYASDVALVKTTPQDSVFEVVETWKGSLRPSNLVSVPELKPSANAGAISSYGDLDGFPTPPTRKQREQIPKQPLGSLMILFLKHRASENASGVPPLRVSPEWEGTWWGDITSSVVWVDDENLYCFRQHWNLGPSLLTLCRFPLGRVVSLAALKSRVTEINQIQNDIARAIKDPDGGSRAERLKPFVRSEVFPAQRLAFEELGKCWPTALATIRGMLDDPDFKDEAPDLIRAYAEAGREAAAEEMARRLKMELDFWRAKAPSLSKGWWNQDPSLHAPLRERFSQTLELLRGLMLTHYVASLGTVTQLRDLWLSLPQLNDPSGLYQMADECDKLIAHLRGPQKSF